MSIDERLAELALINAAPCDMLNAINSETVSELAEAKAAAPSGNLVSAAVVGGGMSAVSLTVLRAGLSRHRQAGTQTRSRRRADILRVIAVQPASRTTGSSPQHIVSTNAMTTSF